MSDKATVKVIAGDIGGTKTLVQLAAFDVHEPSPRGEVVAEYRFECADYPDLGAILQAFLDRTGPVSDLYAACFGVAGPVREEATHQVAQLTNLPWEADTRALSSILGIPRVRLINDFQAVGYGIDALVEEDLVTLQGAEARPRSPRLVLGAGTGLGVGLLVWGGEFYESYPTEGGHIHFAPLDEEQDELLRFLRAEYGRVSYERLVSGPGLVNIYRFLASREGRVRHADPLLGADDPAAAIAGSALEGRDPVARRALELFVSVYGAVAGDLALTSLARGGVYIAGGIAPKILPFLGAGRFMESFRDKGRMRPVVEALPVRVVTNPRVGLLGTALAATRM